jgi:formylglycine-generating enzyme required for sulfatase activity
MRNRRTVPCLAIGLTILLLAYGSMLVLGQGGTGRETPNANSNKKPPPPKHAPTKSSAKSAKPTAEIDRKLAELNKKRKALLAHYTPEWPEVKELDAQIKLLEKQRQELLGKTAEPGSAPSQSTVDAGEIAFWESIKNSTDTKDFKAYLQKYPNGQFATLARDNLTRLETAPKTRVKRDAAGRIILGSISGSKTEAAKPVPKPGSVVRNQMGMELAYVPAGSFMMGSENGGTDEKPAHRVTISNGFYIGKYEVTQAQWQAVMGNNPSNFKDCGGNCPLEGVSWDDAQKFIQGLNGLKDGYTYRLPTDAEWEYACRAGTTGDYAGDPKEMAWFSENSGSKTHAVGGKQPNAWGLADLHGNVWEWCQDWYHETYYGAPTDGSAWLSGGEQKHRVLRGGSWSSLAAVLRSAYRSYNSPAFRNVDLGFRVVAVAQTN